MPMPSRLRSVSERLGLPWYRALPVEAFVRLYRRRRFRALLRPLFPARQPRGVLFVLGCYNSGTTVVKNAIALHPDIAIAPVEGDRLTDALPTFEAGGWPRCLFGNRSEVMRERRYGEVSAGRFLSDLRPWIEPDRYFLEKSISNTVRIPLLRRAFPGTRFVCVVRGEAGVIHGIRRRSRPMALARRILGVDDYPEALLARQWRFFYSMVLDDMNAHSGDVLLCSYEKFIADPVGELGRLFAFLGLSPQPIELRGRMLHVGSRALAVRGEGGACGLDACLDNPEQLRACLEKCA